MNPCLKTGVVDLHSFWSAGFGSVSALGIRIREGQHGPQKWRKFKFWSARCSLLRNEDFSCSLDVLYEGLEISKLQFLIKKYKFLFSCKFLQIFGHQNPGYWIGLDPDPDPQLCCIKSKNSSYGSRLLRRVAAYPCPELFCRICNFLKMNQDPFRFQKYNNYLKNGVFFLIFTKHDEMSSNTLF